MPRVAGQTVTIALRISRNLGFMLWGRSVSILVGVVFLALSARYLGVVDFGKLIFILAAATLVEMSLAGTVDTVLVREQARAPQNRDEHIGATLPVHFAFAAVILLVAAVLAVVFRHDGSMAAGLVAAGVASALQILYAVPVAFFRAEEKMSFEAALVTGERTLFLLGFLGVLWLGGGLVAILACLAVSVSIKTGAAYLWLLRKWPITKWQIRWKKLRYFCVEALPLLGISVLMAVHWRADLMLTKTFSSAEQLGLYAATFRMMEMLRVLPIDVITAAFPIVCKLTAGTADELRRAYVGLVKVSLVLSVVLVGFVFLYADTITRTLFGDSFAEAGWPLRILLLAFPLIFLNQIHNIVLTAMNRQRWMFYALAVAVPCQIVFGMFSIRQRGASGAAAAFGTGELLMLVATLTGIAMLSLGVAKVGAIAFKLGLAAAAAMGAAVIVGGSFPLAGALAATVVYIGTLVLLRVMDRGDLVMVRDSWVTATQKVPMTRAAGARQV